jgi:large subunit ribosomal protein L30
MSWAVVRVRGSIHAKWDIVETLRQLRLTRPNHVVILPESPSHKGMVDKVQGYVTWGPVLEETVALLVKTKGVTPHRTARHGSDPAPTDKKVKEEVSKSSPLFRLKPPRGGWKSTKKPFTMGGALGFRSPEAKDNMDALIRRML